MGHDLELAAKALQEVEPAMRDFAEATGITGPIRELSQWASDSIRIRRAPHTAKLLMRTAERIRQSGLPAHAVSDRSLRALLEDGSIEDDPDMQELWTGLLSAEATGVLVPPAFLRILSELEPVEARALDMIVVPPARSEVIFTPEALGLALRHIDNLVRLGLLRITQRFGKGESLTFEDLGEPMSTVINPTQLARDFVSACRGRPLKG